jgi:hypothetical protein
VHCFFFDMVVDSLFCSPFYFVFLVSIVLMLCCLDFPESIWDNVLKNDHTHDSIYI